MRRIPPLKIPRRDKFVCAECFDDEGLQRFVNENASEQTCTFCARSGSDEIAAGWSEVVDYIDTCLAREYEAPEDGVGRDNESETGWDEGIPLLDTRDLFQELGFGDCPEGLFEDLVDEFNDRQWVQTDPYGSLPCDYWRYAWEAFSRQVKHEMRFVFFMVKTAEDYGPDPEPHSILNALGGIIDQLGLVKVLPQDSVFVRARQHNTSKVVSTVAEIGPPPG